MCRDHLRRFPEASPFPDEPIKSTLPRCVEHDLGRGSDVCNWLEQRMSLSRFGGCLYGPPHRDAISCRGLMTRTSTANVINGFREVMFVTPQAPEDLLASVNTDACHGVASTYNPRF